MPCEAMGAVTRLDFLKEYIKCVWVSGKRGLFSMSRNIYLFAIGCHHGLRNDNGGNAATGRDGAESVGVRGDSCEGHPHYLEDASEGIYWIDVLRCVDQDVSGCCIISQICGLRCLGQHPVIRGRSRDRVGTGVSVRLWLSFDDEQQCDQSELEGLATRMSLLKR